MSKDYEKGAAQSQAYLARSGADEDLAQLEADPIGSLAVPQMRRALALVLAERVRQDHESGFFRDFPDGTSHDWEELAQMARMRVRDAVRSGRITWFDFLNEEFHEVLSAGNDAERLGELVQVSAVCMAWAEAILRRDGAPSPRVSWWKRLMFRLRGGP